MRVEVGRVDLCGVQVVSSYLVFKEPGGKHIAPLTWRTSAQTKKGFLACHNYGEKVMIVKELS